MALEILPFVFLLAVVYGGLEISGVFKNKPAKFIIALVVSYFAMSNPQASAFIESFLPLMGIVFVVVFLLGFVFKTFHKGGDKDWTLIGVVTALILIVFANLYSEFGSYVRQLPISEGNFTVIVALIGFVAILYAAYKKGGVVR